MNGLKALALLIFDSRQGLPSAAELGERTTPRHTMVELPAQRETLRKFAGESQIEIEGEIIVEVDEGFQASNTVAAVLAKMEKLEAQRLLVADVSLLNESGLSAKLLPAMNKAEKMLLAC